MKNNIFLSAIFAALFTFIFCESGFTQTQTADYYNVNSGNNKGLRFWNGSNYYQIQMGNTNLYKYGPVTDYSIKTTMNNNPARGWTWGAYNTTPVAALNTQGNFQTEGWMKNMSRTYYFGNTQRLYGDNSAALYWKGSHSTVTHMRFEDKEGTRYGHVYGNGNGANFGLLDGDGNWSYLAAKDNYTAFRINNSEKMRISSNGRMDLAGAADASGSANTGVIDIDNKLRIDNNEIITNTNSTLYLQNDNNGDLRVDASTLAVDASQNRVGIGFTAPETKLEVKGIVRATNSATRNHRTEIGHSGSDGFINTYGDGDLDFRHSNTTLMSLKDNGKLVIGNVTTPTDDYRLYVEKGILSEKVRVAVKSTSDWSDYVFEKDYEVMPITELEDYVAKNKHLPNVPSAEEVVKDGIDMATMDAKLLEKIEEAHLYIIELHKEMEELKAQINDKQ